MKIKRKPRPTGNEFKTMSNRDQRSYSMKYKKHVHELCATPATCLHLTEGLKGSEQTVVADSWFGSIKSAVQLINQNGLNSIMLVKTAYKNHPVDMLNESQLTQGKWIALQTKKRGCQTPHS